ncbi:MAG: hypothetical protein WGN25_10765 [Candidatus Electrothrix sp. GW3-4]|uniref:hypothetical protein n=1 Tax=Candidatus Electrothrix sp. GW3-4 TaxID=3126740 RepID=UPI0030D370CC
MVLTTEKETQEKPPEQASGRSADKITEKPAQGSAQGAAVKPAGAKRRNTRQRRPKQKRYDQIPIIIFLLLIFSFTLFCLGIGMTRYLSPERAAIPACASVFCSPPFLKAAPQKEAGE